MMDKSRCVFAGESGEMVGKISNKDPLLDFAGYVDKKDTGKKIISDVFVKGDRGFSSGVLISYSRAFG